MEKDTEKFLSLYKTYENLLRDHGTDYRSVEEQQTNGRMTMMRQMRNYLSHAEDPGFISVSKNCLIALEDMVRKESLKGDIVKNHLITPAKGSVREGMFMSAVVKWMAARSILGYQELPVYDPGTKKLKGVILLEWAAYMLERNGDYPINQETYGKYGNLGCEYFLKPTDPIPKNMGTDWYFCTKDGTRDSQYMGYVDNTTSGRTVYIEK